MLLQVEKNVKTIVELINPNLKNDLETSNEKNRTITEANKTLRAENKRLASENAALKKENDRLVVLENQFTSFKSTISSSLQVVSHHSMYVQVQVIIFVDINHIFILLKPKTQNKFGLVYL